MEVGTLDHPWVRQIRTDMRASVVWPITSGSWTSISYVRRERRAGHMRLHVDPPGSATGGSLAGLRDESPESPSPTTTIPVSADCVGTGTVGNCENGTNSVQRSCVLRRSVDRTRNRAVLGRVDRVLQSSLEQTRAARRKARVATPSRNTRERVSSSCQEPGGSREEWPAPAGTAVAECKAATSRAQAAWRARHGEGAQISRHMERLAAFRRRRRRLSRARRPAPAASAGWATAAAATLGGGVRPWASRRAS